MISLDPLTVAYLRRHLAMLDTEKEAFGDSYHDAGWLVCHQDGRPVHPDTITDRFNKLVDRAGVKRIRLHDVRHTYATTSQIGRIASDATFCGSGERVLPATQFAGPGRAPAVVRSRHAA